MLSIGGGDMPIERTLCIIKPNAVEKHVVGKILARFEHEGIDIHSILKTHLTKKQAEDFYKEHLGKPFYQSLVSFMTSNDVVLLVLEAEDVVSRVRKIMGNTNPSKAEANTLRQLYGDNIEANAVHGSDSLVSAEREVSFFFPEISKEISIKRAA